MRMLAIVVLIIAVIVASRATVAHEATPTPRPSLSAAIETVTRAWSAPSGPTTPASLGDLLTRAYRYDRPEHAAAAFPALIAETFTDTYAAFTDTEPLFAYDDTTRLTAPPMGDESQVWSSRVTRLSPPDDAHLVLVLGVRVDAHVVLVQTMIPSTNLHQIDTAAVVQALVQIGRAIQDRQPATAPPRTVGDITVGGLFEVLPGYADVPVGFTVWFEQAEGQLALPTTPARRSSRACALSRGCPRSNLLRECAVAAGTVTLTEDANYLTDGGQFIYCSVPSSGRVLYGKHQSDGSIAIKVKAGEKVVCDWYNLYVPQPQGIGLKLHSYQCPANTSGDIFTKCHRDSKANAGTSFTLQADAGAKTKRTSAAGTFSTTIPTASSGWVWVTITEDASAVTTKGAFVYCSSTGGHPGSGDILGGVTVYDGEVTVQVHDGTGFTCDWYNWT